MTGDVRRFARDTERDLDRALSRIQLDPVNVPVDTDALRRSGQEAGEELGDGITRGADGKLRNSRGQFVKMGADAGKAAGESAGRAAGKAIAPSLQKNTDDNAIRRFLAGIFGRTGTDSATLFANALSGGLKTLPKLIGPTLIVAGLGIAAGIAAAAAPAIGSLIGAALATGAGLGALGLGVLLLKEEPALKSAATRLMDTVKSEFTKAAQPLLEPLVKALGEFEKLAERIAPQLRSMFGALAPAIAPLTEGLIGLVENALPGFVDLVAASRPILEAMSRGLQNIGADLSYMASRIAEASPELAIFWEDFLNGIGWVIAKLGDFINWSAKTYVKIKEFVSGFDSWGEVFDWAVGALQNLVTQGLQYLANNLPMIIEKILAFRQMLTDAVLKMVSGLAEALPTLVPQIVQGVIQLVTGLVNTLAQSAPMIVTAAGELVNGLADGLVNALPTLIPAAV
ncbi:MAG TPA: hypothetical protein VFU47_16705, partial [Armatimonadota bacterium]|nr:hypothetical protein [Armatimonadota bacterium]